MSEELKDKLAELSKLQTNDASMISIFCSASKGPLLAELKKIGEKLKNIKDGFKRAKMQGILTSIFEPLPCF